MNASLSTTRSATRGYLHLQVTSPDGATRTHQLPFGHVLVMGSSAACGLRLESPQVAGMHCTIEYNDKGITLRDWNTESGTFLNGSRIVEERIGNTRFALEIAGFHIESQVATDNPPQKPAPKNVGQTNMPTAVADGTDHDGASSTGETDWNSGFPVNSEGDDRHSLSMSGLQRTKGDDSTAEGSSSAEAEWNEDFDPWDVPDVPQKHVLSTKEIPSSAVAEGYVQDAFGVDTTELLHAEIEFLRSEVAERDQQLRELRELAESPPDNMHADETVSASEAEALVRRLEQLLAELEQNDERMATLNELLRSSEEAVQTSEEERRQLEAWVGEIDRRVEKWQEEWQAERDSLKNTIVELTEQRDRAEQRLATTVSSESSGGAGQDEWVRELRDEYAKLKAAFLRAKQERDQLRSQLEEASVTDAEQRIAAAVETELREERLQLAQEKAALAREKAELGKKNQELQDHFDRKASASDSADHRIRAFREHLREVHEREPARPQGPTLPQRIGKLWRKLEGRTLDTD